MIWNFHLQGWNVPAVNLQGWEFWVVERFLTGCFWFPWKVVGSVQPLLGFKDFSFPSPTWGSKPNLTSIFFRWVVQPPTSFDGVKVSAWQWTARKRDPFWVPVNWLSEPFKWLEWGPPKIRDEVYEMKKPVLFLKKYVDPPRPKEK